MAENTLLSVRDLRVIFDTHHGRVAAVAGVSFDMQPGETLALVGESGSGKSVTSLALLGLIPNPPGIVESDGILWGGRDLTRLSPGEMRRIRGNEISMIFQDPMTSLNPLLTVGQQLAKVLEIHRGMGMREARVHCVRGLGDVGIPHPEARFDAYPHELSGGMRQRVMIAMALLCRPKLLLADEPTTALDVTIQAQILELLAKLQEEHGTAILLITHDLGIVAGMADRVHVMYAGRLVEVAPTRPLFEAPAHPYTAGLLSSVPSLTGDPDEKLMTISGQPPDLAELPPGCAFEPRCPLRTDECTKAPPPLEPVPGEGRGAACLHSDRQLAAEDVRGGAR
ncbi:MAG: ABC transporter ATP-binding protein [Planctomycetota bacterium]